MLLFHRAAGGDFSLLNVIQTVPSVALFGLLIAPLAALVTAFPWLGTLGIAGTGMTPALIALVLYALLPLVRGVVVGRQIARCAGERQSDGDERGAAFPACSVTAGVTGISAQPAGGDGANRWHGGDCGVNRRRRFWCAGFPGLLSSAIDLVLLGVIPVIVLAVLTDALFDLLIALLKVKRND